MTARDLIGGPFWGAPIPIHSKLNFQSIINGELMRMSLKTIPLSSQIARRAAAIFPALVPYLIFSASRF